MPDDRTTRERPPDVDKAVRLFQFLAAAQKVGAKTPRTFESHEKVLWLADVPEHPSVRRPDEDPDRIEAVLEMGRVRRLPPPPPPEELADWVNPSDRPEVEPTLREEWSETRDDWQVDRPGEEVVLRVSDHPEVIREFEAWLPEWRRWAEKERADTPVRAFYDELFSTYQQATNRGDELELILAWGCLGWQPPDDHPAVRRHLLTVPATIDFQDEDGLLRVVVTDDVRVGLTVEDEMLRPGVIAAPDRFSQVQAEARTMGTKFGEDQVVELAQRLANSLDASGQYTDSGRPPNSATTATVAHAPALILRKRSQQGLIKALETIAEQMDEAGEVPEGLMPLVDPDHQPDAGGSWADEPGGLVTVDDTDFLPLPVNDLQLKIIRSVDAKAQTLVQGPPGTGKTHTAAALIAHLLAKGKRVLVTAATDQALREVRGKLPEEIQPLSVSVLRGGREEMVELKTAVQTITTRSHEHDDREAGRRIDDHIAAVEKLRAERAQCYQQLITSREAELQTHTGPDGQAHTLAELARDNDRGREQYGWILEPAASPAGSAPPVTGAELARLRELLTDDELSAAADEVHAVLVDLDREVPGSGGGESARAYLTPGQLAGLVENEKKAAAADETFTDVHGLDAFGALARTDADRRRWVGTELERLAAEIQVLDQRDEAWMAGALDDARRGRVEAWRDRHDKIHQLGTEAQGRVDHLTGPQGLPRTVRCTGDLAAAQGWVPLARNLRQHLVDGGKLKTDAAGRPKTGALTPRIVKEASGFFEAVAVDGIPATNIEALDAFLVWVEAEQFLDAMDRAWPADLAVPVEDTQAERVQWHLAQLKHLDRVLHLADAMTALEAELSGLGVPAVPWHDPAELTQLSRAVAAADSRQALTEVRAELGRVEGTLEPTAQEPKAATCVRQLHAALQSRDPAAYQGAWDRIRHLHVMQERAAERDRISAKLSGSAPGVAEALAAEPTDPAWDTRIRDFEDAWWWADTGAWLAEQGHADVNQLLRRIDAAEREIHRRVEHIAAGRAWRHAVSDERMSGTARADLQHYAERAKRLGKGTGKYAVQRQREVRAAMDRCRPSVPVWIMPLYRVVEQLEMQPDLFDVVVVDEASQASPEASFLQYLAPRIVVIGDDKQVSPSGVGIEEQQLRDLAKQHLSDDPYIDSWQDRKVSFFDVACKFYGDRITLTEHRRCVPEIIGFSNAIAYEPEGFRLVPVRQYGADRLDPVKAVHVPDGYTKGGGQKEINPPEANAIVEQIEKCLADPAYEGKTFGVISMLGSGQDRHIEHQLLERVGPEVYGARGIRCGSPADFQGSERDVIFLSLVKAPEPGKRIPALTTDMHTQRYNVAVSRAKDQVWLFHSMQQSEIANPDCMRFRILDYFYGVADRSTEEGSVGPVPNDEPVFPFDSLFEQRVYNVLYDRGYTVIPQYEVGRYRIDLVIMGARTKVAIECDGDHWHGPDRYREDLARQRDLERCGWTFFRVRESFFYADRAGAMAPLWDLLDKEDIHPSG